MSFKFDWYQATLHGVLSVDLVVSELLSGVEFMDYSEGAGGFNRPFSLRAKSMDGGSLALYFGAELPVHVVATSSLAPAVADVLRERFPGHGVSRADVAFDLDQPGAFDRLYKAVHFIARTPRRAGRGGVVATSTVGDWLDGLDGRTLYAGGPTSALRVRVYEKGHEQRSKHPDKTFSLDWCRVEWQIRPNSAGKLLAATKTPSELAAWTGFGSEVLAAVAALDLEPCAPARVPSTDPLFWMARQYSKILTEWASLSPAEIQLRVFAALELAGSSPVPFNVRPTGSENLPSPPREHARA